jgi:hypothetical protein
LLEHVRTRGLRLKVGTNGAQRGIDYVLKQQMRELRDAIGFSLEEAAHRIRCSVARARVLLRGTGWRDTARIPPEAVRTCQQRLESENGVTFAEAARILGKPVSWLHAQVRAGTIRPLRTPWKKARLYVSLPMFDRLIRAALHPQPRERWSKDWLYLSDAALHVRVSVSIVDRWGDSGEVRRRESPSGYRYHRGSLEARARQHWEWAVKHYRRPDPPPWFAPKEAA